MTDRTTQRLRKGAMFAEIADAVRALGDKYGCTVYVSTNTRSITIDRQKTGQGEYDVHVKVRGDGA